MKQRWGGFSGSSCQFWVLQGIPGKFCGENLLPQFARREFSVPQSGVSSSIAVTTHLIGAPCMAARVVDDGDAHGSEECFVDYVEGFLGDDNQRGVTRRHRNATRNAELND